MWKKLGMMNKLDEEKRVWELRESLRNFDQNTQRRLGGARAWTHYCKRGIQPRKRNLQQ
jgi:hypothetical protein